MPYSMRFWSELNKAPCSDAECLVSPEKIADAVDKVLHDKKRLQSIGKKARKTIIKHYSLQAGIDGYRKLFDEISGTG